MLKLNKIDVVKNAIEYVGMKDADYEVFYKPDKNCWYKLDLTLNCFDVLTTKEMIENILECWLNESMFTELKNSAGDEEDLSNMLKDFYKHVTLLELILNDK